MLGCIVKDCNSDITCINISFHKLPDVLCDVWKDVIGRGNFVPKKSQRICSLHFTSANFNRNTSKNRLKNYAKPTKNLVKSSVIEGKFFVYYEEIIKWSKLFIEANFLE